MGGSWVSDSPAMINDRWPVTDPFVRELGLPHARRHGRVREGSPARGVEARCRLVLRVHHEPGRADVWWQGVKGVSRHPAAGVFYVSSLGFETLDVYVVDWGASEAMVDGDPDFLWMDVPLTLVDKRTAQITVAQSLDSLPLMDAMTPVTARGRVAA